MMSVAAGIATTSKPAVATTFAMFAAGRAYEQVRNSIAYPHLNVKIGATHAGLSVGEDGATHQCLEDLSLMRELPGMTVFSPCDGPEAAKAIKAALEIDGPVYIRMGRSAVDVITDEASEFIPGKGAVVADGKDAVIFATGLMVGESLKARDILAERGIDLAVVNIHTIKPIDEEIIVSYAEKTGHVFTAEDHFITGGLGSAVAEVLCEQCPTPLTRIGVKDTFGRSGTFDDLIKAYGMDAESVANTIEATLKK
jgi:transketolase